MSGVATSTKPTFIRKRAVMEKTGLRSSTLYDMECRDEFPKRIRLTERASAWIASEVDAWIAARIEAARKVISKPKPKDKPVKTVSSKGMSSRRASKQAVS